MEHKLARLEVACMAQDGLRRWGCLMKTCMRCLSTFLARSGKSRYCQHCREPAKHRMKRVNKRVYHMRRMEPERRSELLEAAYRVAAERPAMRSWLRLRMEAVEAAPSRCPCGSAEG